MILLVHSKPRLFIYTTKDVKEGDILYMHYGDEFKNDKFIYIKNIKDIGLNFMCLNETKKTFQERLLSHYEEEK